MKFIILLLFINTSFAQELLPMNDDGAEVVTYTHCIGVDKYILQPNKSFLKVGTGCSSTILAPACDLCKHNLCYSKAKGNRLTKLLDGQGAHVTCE